MFTIQQIKEAHSKVKSGADFPKLVQYFIQLGIVYYDSYVCDGHKIYFGADNYHLETDLLYPTLDVASSPDIEQFKYYLKIHQQGETDYPTFCKHAAETGVEKWSVHTVTMTCTYYDKDGKVMLMESIPAL